MTATNIPIDRIVKVDIIKELVVPSLEDFGLFNLVSENIAVIPTAERYRMYDDLDAVEADFGDTSAEYYAAASFFGQQPTPVEFMISTVDIVGGETYVESIINTFSRRQFYGLGVTNLAIDDATVLAIAQYAQTKLMLNFYQTSAADVLTAVDTDIASQLLSLDRTVVCWYEATNTTTRHDLALAGFGFTRQPGAFNWANNSLIGTQPTEATIPQIDFAEAKKVNFYYQVQRGISITRLGFTSGSVAGISYIDQRTGIDWTQIAMQQETFQLLVSSDRVPYTDSGLNAIEGKIKAVLDTGVSLGIYAAIPAPTVTHLPVAQVPASDKQARISPIMNFTARLAGAINFIDIKGTLTG